MICGFWVGLVATFSFFAGQYYVFIKYDHMKLIESAKSLAVEAHWYGCVNGIKEYSGEVRGNALCKRLTESYKKDLEAITQSTLWK